MGTSHLQLEIKGVNNSSENKTMHLVFLEPGDLVVGGWFPTSPLNKNPGFKSQFPSSQLTNLGLPDSPQKGQGVPSPDGLKNAGVQIQMPSSHQSNQLRVT